MRGPDGEYVGWDDVERICAAVGLKTVPVIQRGKVTIEDLESFADRQSVLAQENGIEDPENTWEGVVIKTAVTDYDSENKRHCLKYKSKKWAERAACQTKIKTLDPDAKARREAASEFAEAVVLDGRVHTIIDHITRDGDANLCMERTAEFLREMVSDIQEDCPDVYNNLCPKGIRAYNGAISSLAVKKWKEYLDIL
ncbi:MAG: RNA ligase family protein [Candidatus Njordarchaeales archaeon]